MEKYEIYIDESCHLEHDRLPAMGIGYIKLNAENHEAYKNAIKAIKKKHITPMEIKWTGVSKSRLPLYKELINYFFSHDIDFRCILVKYKHRLDHAQFNDGEHDNFYYKMVYHLLNSAVNPNHSEYNVYLDVLNTRNAERRKKIENVLDNEYDGKSPFVFFQHIHSENVFVQLADLFVGAVVYKTRGAHLKNSASETKKELINFIEEKSGYVLDEGTPPWEMKFNIFDHQPKKTVK